LAWGGVAFAKLLCEAAGPAPTAATSASIEIHLIIWFMRIR